MKYFCVLIVFISLASCGLLQKVDRDCYCRCLNRDGNNNLGSLSGTFVYQVNVTDDGVPLSEYSIINFSDDGQYFIRRSTKLSKSNFVEWNNYYDKYDNKKRCYKIVDSLVIMETYSPLVWSVSYFRYKDDKLVFLYNGRRFMKRCKLFDYHDIIEKIDKGKFGSNLFGKTYFKIDLDELENQIEVTGIARNAKLGAVVTTGADSVYYIDNLDMWPEDLYDKRVLVKGNLKVIYEEKEVINGKTKPYIPRRNVLYDATFKVLKE